MNESFEELLALYESGGLSDTQLSAFFHLLEKEDNRVLLEKAIEQKWLDESAHFAEDNERTELAVLRLRKALKEREEKEAVKIRSIWFNYRRWVAAASILLVLATGAYFGFIRKQLPGNIPQQVLAQDVQAPDKNRALITLADGSIVYLDEANDGRLAQVGNVNLVKLDNGQIAYEYAEEASAPLSSRRGGGGEGEGEVYNTLYNPRGSQVIDITLSDGTRVWLNAGSAITYPVAFVGNERKVEIQGEGYFEVAPSNSPEGGEKRPFRVMLPASADGEDRGEVLVLGTHFNVNAYDDEEDIKVTLLEGNVHLKRTLNLKPQTLNLKPGQQGIIKPLALSLNSSPSLDQVMAWKNGYFSFRKSSLSNVMKQIARWYNVEVEYTGTIPEMHFGGEISRSSSLTQVMTILAKSKVNFKIENKKIVISK